MALKPTIYKAKIAVADIDRNHYNDLDLTVALHPSETTERMMARVLAFCMNDRENLAFTRGLSSVEEPDIWERALDGRISLWVDIGEPSFDRIKKAVRLSQSVKIYSFNFKSRGWWLRDQAKFNGLPVSVFRFDWQGIQTLAGMVTRTMTLSVTISDGTLYISTENGECEVPWTVLQA